MLSRSFPLASFAFVLLSGLAFAPLLLADVKTYPASEQLWLRGKAYYDSRNYTGALPILVEAAKLNDPRAQTVLGMMYQEGKGVHVDERIAAGYFGRAAAQGHRGSQYSLGALYEYGKGGLPQDYRMAAQYYTASAQQGYSVAQYSLALLYELGHGVPRNRATAINWLNAAAAQGDGDAAWLATWLRRTSTPSFNDEEHLAGYITAQVYASTPHPPPGGIPTNCGLTCAQELEKKRVRQANKDAGINNYQP